MTLGTWREDAGENAKLQEKEKIKLAFGGINTAKSGQGSTYRYPNSGAQITPDTDYVTFEFFKYKPPFKDTGGGNKKAQYDTSVNFGKDDIIGEKFGKNIIMYMPEDIQSEYGANWSGAGFGFLGGRLLKAAGGNFDLGQLGADLGDYGRKQTVDFIVGAANKALGSGVSTNQALGGISGKIVNPNV